MNAPFIHRIPFEEVPGSVHGSAMPFSRIVDPNGYLIDGFSALEIGTMVVLVEDSELPRIPH
jgi:hypothetical protein